MYENDNELWYGVALFCRRITTFLEMHSDSTLVRAIMDESAVKLFTLRAARCMQLQYRSFLAFGDGTSLLNLLTTLPSDIDAALNGINW